MNLRTFHRRIGILGMRNSGKTVLLTSLINHLQEHDPLAFDLDSGEIRNFKESKLKGRRFDYEHFRDRLGRGEWPSKTKDRYAYRCQFDFTKWRMSKVDLHFVDLPGERLADVFMASRNFEEWSDQVLVRLNQYPHLAEIFLNVQEQGEFTEDAILEAYRVALARLLLDCKPLISPSVFWLDQEGTLPKRNRQATLEAEARWMARQRLSGLSGETQFAPLTERNRHKYPKLVRRFSTNYEDYRRQVVDPLLADIAGCHQHVVLVDVPDLLASGQGAYNDFRASICHLLGETILGTPWWKRGTNLVLPGKWRLKGVDRICFAASKADLVHPEDADKLGALVRQMTRRITRNLQGIQTEVMILAAVESTVALDRKADLLVGRPQRNTHGEIIPRGEQVALPVSRLPDQWPDGWTPEEYRFPRVYPDFVPRWDAAPRHRGLDQLLRFLLEL